MKLLILGDICGSSGMKAVQKKLKKIIIEKNIDFTIANGENAADTGKGITKKNISDLLESLFSISRQLKSALCSRGFHLSREAGWGPNCNFLSSSRGLDTTKFEQFCRISTCGF